MTDAVAKGLELLASGLRALRHSDYLLSMPGCRDEAEAKARSSLTTLRSALDWLEDTEHAENAHLQLDAAGRHVRETYGCHLSYSDSSYWQECPVALAHVRVGMSVGYIVREVECSICHGDHNTCEHVTGREYEGQVCHRNVTECDLTEVSLVSRPANPDCRILKQSMSPTELATVLGPAFRPGMPVSCDRCLNPCDGLREVPAVVPNHISQSGRMGWNKPEGATAAGEATVRLA